MQLRKNYLNQNKHKRKSIVTVTKKVHRLFPIRGLFVTNICEKNIFVKYSIFAESYGYITKNQLETVRRLLKRSMKFKNVQFIIRMRPFVTVTRKPLQARMGGGKGSRIGSTHFTIIPGQCLIEFETPSHNTALKLFVQIANKLRLHISWSNNYIHLQNFRILKYLMNRDIKNRYINYKLEANDYSRKSILYNVNLSFYDIIFFFDINSKFALMSKTMQIHNRCLLTNRSRAILNFCFSMCIL